ncbi:unnamed protein product [Boreogadus saida]
MSNTTGLKYSHENGTKMNFTLQPFAKETLTGPQRAWSSRDNIHTFCVMKRSDYRQTIDITCKDTEHLAGLHIEMQSQTKWVKIKHFKPSKNETQHADEVKEETSKLKWSDRGTSLVWVKDYGC